MYHSIQLPVVSSQKFEFCNLQSVTCHQITCDVRDVKNAKDVQTCDVRVVKDA
jgi:hypothetical protein